MRVEQTITRTGPMFEKTASPTGRKAQGMPAYRHIESQKGAESTLERAIIRTGRGYERFRCPEKVKSVKMKKKSHLEVGGVGEVFDNHVRRENADTAAVEIESNNLQGGVGGGGRGDMRGQR